MTLKRVDLPAPLGPINPVIVPLAIVRLAPSTARKPPKCLCRFSTSIKVLFFLDGDGMADWQTRYKRTARQIGLFKVNASCAQR
jgi:hypothetical protein